MANTRKKNQIILTAIRKTNRDRKRDPSKSNVIEIEESVYVLTCDGCVDEKRQKKYRATKTISLRRNRVFTACTLSDTHRFEPCFSIHSFFVVVLFIHSQSTVPLWKATTITKGSPVVSTCSSPHSLEVLFFEINLHCFLQMDLLDPKHAHKQAKHIHIAVRQTSKTAFKMQI